MIYITQDAFSEQRPQLVVKSVFTIYHLFEYQIYNIRLLASKCTPSSFQGNVDFLFSILLENLLRPSKNILPPFSSHYRESLSETTQLISFRHPPRRPNIFNGDVPLIEMFILLVLIEGTGLKSGNTSALICVCTQAPRWPSRLFCHCSLEITTARRTGYVGAVTV